MDDELVDSVDESPDLLDDISLPLDEEPEFDPYDLLFPSDEDPEPTSGDLVFDPPKDPPSMALESTLSELPRRSAAPPATVSEKSDTDIAIGRAKKSAARTKEHDLEIYANKEKEIQRIVLQTTACGYMDIVNKALSVLHQVQRRLKRSGEGLNFIEGKERELLWKNQYYTPLMYACEGGHKEMVEFLLENGARINYVGGYYQLRAGRRKRIGAGLNAMHVACIQGKADIVQLLIQHAEDKVLTAVLNAKSKDQWSPLMYAVKRGHTEVVKVLLEQQSVKLLARNRKGQTALHIAALHCRLDCLKVIHAKLALEETSATKLAKVDDENPYLTPDKRGHNVLHRVSKGPRGPEGSNGTVETLKWLFETMPHLDHPKIHNLKTEKEGYSMLLLACDNGNRGLVEYLLIEKGVDVSSTTNDGKTGLHLAALHDYPDVAEPLIKCGISLTAQDYEHKKKGSEKLAGEDTALHIAVRKSSQNVEQKIRLSDGNLEALLQIKNKLGEIPDLVKRKDTIPLEIARLGEEIVQRYRELLRKGKKKRMPRCNLIALGEEGVGKTSLLCLLMGKKFIEDRDSTRGIDNERVFVMPSSVSLSSETWKEVNEKDMTRANSEQYALSIAADLQVHFKSKFKKQQVPSQESLASSINAIEQYLQQVEEDAQLQQSLARPLHHKFLSNTSSQPVQQDKNRAGTSSKVEEVNTPKSKPASRSQGVYLSLKPETSAPRESHTIKLLPDKPERDVKTAPRHSDPHHTPRESQVSLQLSKKIISSAKLRSGETESVLQYNTLDFAGQKEYRAMHHCFVIRRAIYLVVFNLQIIRDTLISQPTLNKCALEEIHYWLNSIHAHIHKIEADSLCKRVMLVGTHQIPKGKQITDEDMEFIDTELSKRFLNDTPILNDMYRADPRGKLWFAAVENSIDGQDKHDRDRSGATSLQESIHKAWNELPFKDEEYPTTWLRFETFLNEKRTLNVSSMSTSCIVDVTLIRDTAREVYGIGQEDEEDIELALGFFHDTGTIVYPKKLPTLFLTTEEKVVLDGLVLLNPAWLTNMMRAVMELQTGKGCKLTNEEIHRLNVSACAKASVLKRCWNELNDAEFDKLMLMLQSFCLIYPLPVSELQAAKEQSPTATAGISSLDTGSPQAIHSLEKASCKQSSTTTAGSSSPDKQDTESSTAINWEEKVSSTLDKVYLIPSKLCVDPPCISKSHKKLFNFTFEFDFGGFLPVEVYHRLLCLMLKNQSCSTKSKGRFTANFFKIHGVEECNWLVRMTGSKLLVSVKYPPESLANPPSFYVRLIHTNYLRAICDEKGSSLQGLKYVGGPVHMCDDNDNDVVVVPCVSFPEEKMVQNWKCDFCLHSWDIDRLLDCEFKRPSSQSCHNPSLECVEPSRAQLQVSNAPCPAILPLTAESTTSTQPSNDKTFCIKDLYDILMVLHDVTKEWKMLGLALGLLPPTIDKIEQKGDLDDCKYEMVKDWLNRKDGSNPTRNCLIEALKTKLVGLSRIAENINVNGLLL